MSDYYFEIEQDGVKLLKTTCKEKYPLLKEASECFLQYIQNNFDTMTFTFGKENNENNI